MKDLRKKIEEILINFIMDYPFYRGSSQDKEFIGETIDKLEALFKEEMFKLGMKKIQKKYPKLIIWKEELK